MKLRILQGQVDSALLSQEVKTYREFRKGGEGDQKLTAVLTQGEPFRDTEYCGRLGWSRYQSGKGLAVV